MGEPDNVRAFVAPAYAEEVRRYLLPFAESYGKAVERAVDYVLTGRNPEVVGELMATIVRYDDAVGWRFLSNIRPLWTLQEGLPKLTLLRATDDASLALAARFLHVASPILAGDKSRSEFTQHLTDSEWFALSIAGDLEDHRVRAPIAPYLKLLALLGLPEHFLLARRLALHATKDCRNEYETGWPELKGLDAYIRRHPQCWERGLSHCNPRIQARTFQMANHFGYDLPGQDSQIFACAIGTRADLRSEAQDFIATDPARFEDRIREAPTHRHASARAASLELVERFLPTEEALSIAERLRNDRSKKVQQRAQAAIDALRPSDETETEQPSPEALDVHIDLDAPLHQDVRAALISAYDFLRGDEVPSLDATLCYVDRGVGELRRGCPYDEWEGAKALWTLSLLPDLTLVQYLRFLRWGNLLEQAYERRDALVRYDEPARHLCLGSSVPWLFSSFAKSRARPPSMLEIVAAFRALGWHESGVTAIALAGEDVFDGWELSTFVELREEDLIEMWRKPETSLFGCSTREEVMPRLAAFCESLPALPDALMNAVWDVAVGNAVTLKPHAQRALGNKPGVEPRVLESLRSKKQGVRRAAATWAADAQFTNAIPELQAALNDERSAAARDGMLDAIIRLGGSIDPWITPERLREVAESALKKGVRNKVSWFPFDSVPELRWSNGDSVDPLVVQWLIVQAHTLRDPNPSPQLRRIAEKLSSESARDLSAAVFRAWLLRDSASEITGEPQCEFGVGTATADKGLLGLVVPGGSADTIDQARRYIYKYYGLQQGQCMALLRMVSAIDVPDSLLLLQRIARRFRTDSIQDEAARVIEDYAAARGWSKEELGDRTTPTGGLDESGRFALSFGENELRVELNPASLLLVIRSETGKVYKSLPKPRVGDDAALVKEAKQQLGAARRQVKAVVADRKAALYEAMCLQRRWSFPVWVQYLCAHPITGLLCRRLVWLCESSGATTTFAPVGPGSFVDTHGMPFMPEPDSEIRLAHETQVSDAVQASWTTRFEIEGIEHLFPQFGRMATIRRVFPTYGGGLPNVKGMSVSPVDFYRMALSAGFAKGPIEDGPTICAFIFRLPGSELVGILECEGVDLGLLNTVTREIYEAIVDESPRMELTGLTICNGEGYDRDVIDIGQEHAVPAPLVVELAAAAAKSIGEGLRLVRPEGG